LNEKKIKNLIFVELLITKLKEVKKQSKYKIKNIILPEGALVDNPNL